MFFISIQVPLLPILPVISVFVNVYLMLKLSSATWIRFGVWMFLGRWHGIRILHPFTFQYHSSCWAANSKNWNICYSFFLFLCTADSQSLYITIFHTRKMQMQCLSLAMTKFDVSICTLTYDLLFSFLPGFLIYFSYSLHHSVESQHDEHIPLSPRSDQDESSDDNIFSEDEESDHVLWNRK